MKIVVNGQEVDFDAPNICYEDVLWIADERSGATVTYTGPRHGDSQRSGILYAGKPPIQVEAGMRFNCAMTNNA